MHLSILRPFVVSGAVVLLAGCATTDTGEAPSSTAGESSAGVERRGDAPRERPTATELAVAERRAPSGGREGGGSAPTETAKLVDQLNEAARELATLRTANAKLRAERERPRPAPAAETVAKADPADERLVASLKSYAQFKQEMAAFLAEIDRVKKSNADVSAELKLAAEQTRQAKAALQRVEDDLRAEKKSREAAEASVAELREQLRAIARAMASAGLSAERLSAPAAKAETASPRSR